ncbi:DUF87 domain-containing protein, partial [Candidatus Microgenomates bacterium]|nr:DUF87 domain-containing protein [Candidatus Microgenomates bacterium]
MYTDYTPPDVNITSILIGLILLGFLVVVIAILGYIGYIFYKNKNREDRSIDSVLLQVAVQRSNEVKIDAMEQIFAVMSSFKKSGWKQKFDIQPTVSFEIVAQKEDIRFYVWVPKKYQDLIEKTIHGAYPDAEIISIPEYNIFTEEGKVAYKSLQLKKDNFYPIRVYKDMPIDPMSAITSALAKMGEGEAAAIQIILSPTDIPWSKAGRDFISTTKKNESDPEKAKFSVPAKTLESVESKISKPGFETTIRMVVVSTSEDVAKAHLTNISASFEQFNGELNGLGGRKVKNKGAFIEDFLYRYQPMFNWNKNHASVLNVEELATIFHFPNKQITTPHIYWLNAKSAPAPAEIPTEGLYLGSSDYRGIKRPVYISETDRLRHMYIIGKTGTGKSELLKSMMMQDIRAGKGLCFIDPHGDAVEQLLEMIPPERAEDVIYFD